MNECSTRYQLVGEPLRMSELQFSFVFLHCTYNGKIQGPVEMICKQCSKCRGAVSFLFQWAFLAVALEGAGKSMIPPPIFSV